MAETDSLFELIFGKPPSKKPKRKKRTVKQRFTPCEWCAYPLSQRHHPFPVHKYGESSHTVQLCPNCHELYHIIYNALAKRQKLAANQFLYLLEIFGNEDKVLGKAIWFVSVIIHAEQGDLNEWLKQQGIDHANENGDSANP